MPGIQLQLWLGLLGSVALGGPTDAVNAAYEVHLYDFTVFFDKRALLNVESPAQSSLYPPTLPQSLATHEWQNFSLSSFTFKRCDGNQPGCHKAYCFNSGFVPY